jgi:5'-methylthioadenosine phosphorylase
MPVLGVIAGSGIYDIPGLEIVDSAKMSTPYGEPSDVYRIGRLAGKDISFLPRHGSMHHIQPHKINYRANIWGFRELGVTKIISIGASGGISREMIPGTIAVLDQIIDMTSGRASTFYDEDEVLHIDFTEPFCSELRRYLLQAAEKAGIAVAGKGTYVCSNGPRLESAAEVRAYGMLGADVVGMTGMPEAVLARELEICFAALSVVTNFAAGVTAGRLTASEVSEAMRESAGRVTSLLRSFFTLEYGMPACNCGTALKQAKM